MAQIAIRIPTGETSAIQGECVLGGYEGCLLADKVTYSIVGGEASNSDGRRTVQTPEFSDITIERTVDVATADLTRYMLTMHVPSNSYPWEIYFFKTLGGGLMGSLENAVGSSLLNSLLPTGQVCYLTITLHDPLVISQNVSAEESGLKETLHVSASAIDWAYTAYADDQSAIGNMAFSFDVQAGSLG